MCIRANLKQKKTATEAIVVYKLLRKDNRSPFHCDFLWEENKTYEQKIKEDSVMREHNENFKIKALDDRFLGPGFHVCASAKRARALIGYKDEKVVVMVIPKGAEYYHDVYGAGNIITNKIQTTNLDSIIGD